MSLQRWAKANAHSKVKIPHETYHKKRLTVENNKGNQDQYYFQITNEIIINK